MAAARFSILSFGVVATTALIGIKASHAAAPAVHSTRAAAVGNPCPNAAPFPASLQAPATVAGDPVAYEKQLLNYLRDWKYRKLGWCRDKYVRDTGPYLHGKYFGPHPAVRIYYSPEMMTWLRGGRKGTPRDGAVMIKEQYDITPAARYRDWPESSLQPNDWTIMIRNARGSHDGWFWIQSWTAEFPTPPPGATPTPTPAAFTGYPNSGYGLACIRCHASAGKSMTFASTKNIEGFPGEPLTYIVDDSWRATPVTPPPAPTPVGAAGAPSTPPPAEADTQHRKHVPEPPVAHSMLAAHGPRGMQTFPPEPLDTYVAHPGKIPQFMTSDQCMSCHAALSGPPSGPAMWYDPRPFTGPPPTPTPTPTPLPNGPSIGVNVSEYGEWRWSPMGLAGRDPVFFSQLESELQYIAKIPASHIQGNDPPASRKLLQAQVVDTCMRCHGVMGKRTNDIEHPGTHFDEKWVFRADPALPGFHYGGLARDGISCTVCHRIVQSKRERDSLAFSLNEKSTGRFDVERKSELAGPFPTTTMAPDNSHDRPVKIETIASHPMKESLGITPVYSSLTTSAHMCTSCHSINLPVIDSSPKFHPILPEGKMHYDVEQSTYVEWVNSSFQTEYKPGAGARSCQACHMPTNVVNERLNVDVPQIRTRIAVVQDETYPAAEALAPIDQITVRYREHGYHRHELLGLNAFLLTTFRQNPDALGVRLGDYMSGSASDLDDAVGNVVRQARRTTAKVDLNDVHVDKDGMLFANVGVTNLTGHRFPSGVGFRRAFLELRVVDSSDRTVFVSGSTDERGFILGADGKPLPSETFSGPIGQQAFQPHFDEQFPIQTADQVQIFEELVKEKSGAFTDSFVRRDAVVKDNRLLPHGWKPNGQPGIALPLNWLEATRPHLLCGTPPAACTDPHYDGSARAVVAYRVPLRTAVDASQLRVRATLWYQAWEPNFLRNRTSGGGDAAYRLQQLIANTKLDGTPLENWKLRIASSCAPMPACTNERGPGTDPRASSISFSFR